MHSQPREIGFMKIATVDVCLDKPDIQRGPVGRSGRTVQLKQGLVVDASIWSNPLEALEDGGGIDGQQGEPLYGKVPARRRSRMKESTYMTEGL
jgi:hypothetical protein